MLISRHGMLLRLVVTCCHEDDRHLCFHHSFPNRTVPPDFVGTGNEDEDDPYADSSAFDSVITFWNVLNRRQEQST